MKGKMQCRCDVAAGFCVYRNVRTNQNPHSSKAEGTFYIISHLLSFLL